jgi:nickel-dependent lactate racemase
MKKAYVKYRKERVEFEIPSHWNLLTLAEFDDHESKKNVRSIVRESLIHPISSPPLKELVSDKDTIAIIVEDLSRVSPKKEVLGELLKTLDEIAIPDDQITVVMALGTHRGLTRKEMEDAFGASIVKRYRIINHDCLAPDLVAVGKLRSGRTVKINPVVHRAAFKIGIGSIFPHPMNGFGGGGKILFPGVSDFDSILEHHLRYAFRPASDLGLTDGNPFYEEVMALAKAAKLDFIINSVLDHNDHLYDIVAGPPLDAHRAGALICKQILSKQFEKKSDLTVISSFPYTEGTQIMKPLAPATLITKVGGCVILVASFTVPLAEQYLSGCKAFRENHGFDNLREAVIRQLDSNQRILADGAPEFNMSMAQALLAQSDFRIILVTDDMSEDQVARIGFQYAPDIQTAFELAREYCPRPDVHVVPSGGVILPVIDPCGSSASI